MKRYTKNNKGFTLLELVLVIALVGVLASVAAPGYLDYANKAEEKKNILIRNRAKSEKNAEYNLMLGNCLLNDGEFNEAVYYYKRALEIDPKYSQNLLERWCHLLISNQ